MNRRNLLTGAAAFALVGPTWLQRAFAGPLDCPKRADRLATVSSGLDRARKAGKPLLVLVAPRDAHEGAWMRGSAFGQWLNHGGDAALADLAQVEVIAARTADVRAMVKGLGEGDPLMWWIGVDGVVERLDAPLETVVGRDQNSPEPQIDRNIAALRGLLRGALDRTTAARLQAVPNAQAYAGALASLSPEQVDAGAAVLAQRPEPEVRAALAEAARRRVVRERIPGSHWVRGHGCGETVEGVDGAGQRMMACGMGFVPARSARFVRFLACTE